MSKLSRPVFPRPKNLCKTGGNREPDELRKLKYQLANINCKCGTCATPKMKTKQKATIKYSKSATNIEVNKTDCIDDKFIVAAPTAPIEPATQMLHVARTHIRRPSFMNEHLRSGTGVQVDQTDSIDTFIQASNNTASVGSNRHTLEFALTHLSKPTFISGYTSGTGVQADQTECTVEKFIQPSFKTASVYPGRQTVEIALRHLRAPAYMTPGTGIQADKAECSVDRFIQASSETALKDPSPQTLQFALIHVSEPSCSSGYDPCTNVKADHIDCAADKAECSVDRFIQASSETALKDPSTHTLQFALIHVREPSCSSGYDPCTNVKADHIDCAADTFIQASQAASIEPKIQTVQGALSQLCKHNVLCPACAMAFNFLRGELSKVCKDEETATVTGTNSDKSTTYDVTSVDKTTSMKLLVESPNLSLTDYFTSKLSSGTSIGHRSSRVRFRDEIEQTQCRMRQIYNLNYLSIDSFIDSIRPPL